MFCDLFLVLLEKYWTGEDNYCSDGNHFRVNYWVTLVVDLFTMQIAS